MLKIAKKLQICKDYEKKEIVISKIYLLIQNYFEKVLYENLTFEILPLCKLWFLRVVS